MPAGHFPLRNLQPNHIAILKPSALGDIVHSLPILSALRSRFPHSKISWVVNSSYAPLLEGHPDLDQVLPFDRGAVRSSWRKGIFSYLRLLRSLRQQQFDLVVDLQGLLRTGVMAFASGAPRRVGLSCSREGTAWCYTDLVPVPAGPMHAVDRYWLVAEALGVGAAARQFRVHVSEEARRWASELLRRYPRPWLVVGPGARWVTKRWPPQHFATLGIRAQVHFGGTVVLVGGADTVAPAREILARLEAPRVPQFKRRSGCTVDLTGKTSLPQLAALLQLADVMVGNDTGPLHLAVALGTPVVAPYTCTQVALTGPYRSTGAVQSSIWCQGSLRKRCPRLECMAELTPERLWPVLYEVLLSWESPLPSFRMTSA